MTPTSANAPRNDASPSLRFDRLGTVRSIVSEVLLAGFLAAGCLADPVPLTTASLPTSASSPSDSSSTSAPTRESGLRSPDVPVAPSAVAIDLEQQPRVDLGTENITAVCDREQPSELGSSLYCSDALASALEAFRATIDAPIDRLYLHRPPCPGACSEDELSTGVVTAWTDTGAFRVSLDSRTSMVLAPAVEPKPQWPEPEVMPAPAVRRVRIDDAPPSFAARTPYPYCGRVDVGAPANVASCFRNLVLAGLAAEMLDQEYSVEGDPVLWIYRYDGRGTVIRVDRSDGRWLVARGALNLGSMSSSWDFDPWSSVPLK